MKKNLLFLALGAMALASCGDKQNQTPEVDPLAEMEAKYQEATNFNDSLLVLMGDIYAGLDSINTQEGILVTMGQGDDGNSRDEIRNNLTAIRLRLENNKRLLAELEKKANESGNKSAILQRTIDQMKERIAAQDERIAELTGQLAEANEQISDLTDIVQETKEQLAGETQAREEAEAQTVAVENQANTIYYVIGTNKQLKEWKVLEKRFLGATKVMQGDDINYACFMKADKRNLLSIPTNAKKAEIKSLNDKESYVIEGEKDGPKTIRITNPELFWQKTPYLVIQIN